MSGKFFRRWAGNIRDNLDTLSRFYRGQSVAFKKTGQSVAFKKLDGVSSFWFSAGNGKERKNRTFQAGR